MSYIIDPPVWEPDWPFDDAATDPNKLPNLPVIQDWVPILPTHPTKTPKMRTRPIDLLVLHCTANQYWGPIDVARYDIGPNHISKTGLPTITYHYMILDNGTICRTCPEEVKTAHVGEFNNRALGVALQWEGRDVLLPSDMYVAISRLMAMLMLRHPGAKFVLHRELPGTGWVDLNGNGIYDGPHELRKVCPGMSIHGDVERNRAYAQYNDWCNILWSGGRQ